MRLPNPLAVWRHLVSRYRLWQAKKAVKHSFVALVQQGGYTPDEAKTLIREQIDRLPVSNGAYIRLQQDDGRIYKL